MPTPYPDSRSASKIYLLLLCKAISADHNKDSSICPQILTFLALSLSWVTFQQANSWSVISPFGGLASYEKGHNVGDLPRKTYTTTLPLPHLILICTRCSYCCWLTDLFSVCSHLLFITVTICFSLLREDNLTAWCCVSRLVHMAHSGKFIWIILSSGLVEPH